MAAAVAAVGLLGGVVVLRVQREREWDHGGDRVAVGVEVALAGQDTFDGVAVRLGVPPGRATRLHGAEQSVVVRVRWSGGSQVGGSFQLIALDGRVAPPRPLVAEGGWSAEGGTGANWASAYEVLGERYDWLAGGRGGERSAVGVPATAAGTVTAWFRPVGEGSIPFADAGRDVAVALVFVDDGGEVRWARRISG